MNQRTFLGLTHNPFTAPREGFFPAADRKSHLDHLRHLSQWSRHILMVSGAFGSGKSTLFRELSGSLESGVKGARLSGTVVASEREALVGLLHGFGIAASLDAHTDDMADIVKRFVNEQEELGRVCLVMVDDAHLLDPKAVECLVAIAGGAPLRVLLFSEAGLVPELERITRSAGQQWFEIPLSGLSAANTRDYLEWRFNQAHYRGRLPFTDEQLEKIVQRSKGNFNVIDSMANRMLEDLESGEARKVSGRFPTTHAFLAVALFVLVGLVYLFVQDEPEQTRAAVATQPIELPQIETPANEEIDDGLSQGEENTGDVFDTQEEVVPDVVDVPADEGLSEPVPDPVVEAPASSAADEGQPELEEATDLASLLASTPVEIEQSTTEQSPSTSVSLSEQEAESEPIAEPEPQSVPAPQFAAANPRYKNAAWILNQSGERYTTQLVTLSSLSRAEAFINRQSNPEEFGLYSMQRDGRTLFVVIYGVFSGRSGAQTAVNGFTGELARMKPWIRPLSLVQDTIRQNPQ